MGTTLSQNGMNQALVRPLRSDDVDFLRDESRVAGQAESISFPVSEADVCAVLEHCRKAGLTVTLQGARTGLAAGAVPAGGHVMNLSQMNQVLAMRRHADGHFSLRVQPGLILARLRQILADRRLDTSGWDLPAAAAWQDCQRSRELFFAPDPTETTASLGGMAACNASGARSFRYGPMRSHVRGLRVVLSNGQTLLLERGACKARHGILQLVTLQGQAIRLELPGIQMPSTKSAAGYYIHPGMDAVDLFIGSDGTLGVLTEIELDLLVWPHLVWGVMCFFQTPGQTFDFVSAARQDKRASLATLEYFDDHVLMLFRQVRDGNPAYARLPLPVQDGLFAVYCELHEESEAAAMSDLAWLGQLMQCSGADPADSWVARTDADRDALIFFRHAAPECVNQLIDQRRRLEPSIAKLGTDMSVPDAYLRQVMTLYQEDLADSGLEYAIWGHIGNNHVHVNILPRNLADFTQGKALYASWAESVIRWGGSVSAEHGIGKTKRDMLLAMYGPSALSGMAGIKQILDPSGMLGPGNLFPDSITGSGRNGADNGVNS